MLIVRCGWCKVDQGTKPCEPKDDGMVTHGICEPCLKKVTDEMNQMMAKKDWQEKDGKAQAEK